MPYSDEHMEREFRKKVETALTSVRAILDNTRKPQSAAEVHHTYNDKYALAEFLTTTATAAILNVLEMLGLEQSDLKVLKDMYDKHNKSVTLRLAFKETCTFMEEKQIQMENPEVEVQTSKTKKPNKETVKTRTKVVSKITEYHFKIGLQYILFAYAGSDPDATENSVVLQGRSSNHKIIISGNKENPYPNSSFPEPIEISLDWLLKHIDLESTPIDSQDPKDKSDSHAPKKVVGNVECKFNIDRSQKKACRTPRNNEQINEAVQYFYDFKHWAREVCKYFINTVANIVTKYPPPTPLAFKADIGNINDRNIFVPILPLFEETNLEVSKSEGETMKQEGESTAPLNDQIQPSKSHSETNSLILPLSDINKLLQEQIRSLEKKIKELDVSYQRKTTKDLISAAEAKITLLMLHIRTLADTYVESVDYIEDMLRSQLVSAIGKDLKPSDFEEFFRLYCKKLLLKEFQPRPFCYSIRRPNHFPDGTLSIESGASDLNSDPITTITRTIDNMADRTMHFSINAATNVDFQGDIHLHAWLLHDFRGESRRPNRPGSFRLVARAKQFSNFMLVIGTVSGPDSFEPQHAIIVQNKDEVLIPLLLDQLPTPKEFKDAIESLSPEQQEFAKAFRDAQLESSVLGVCVIQLKPQLEKLLGLPDDALTKEVKLTQNILSLFIDYQIPSDLLTYDGDEDATLREKVERIKEHVHSVQEIISETKKEQLSDAEQQTNMHLEQQMQDFPPPMECFGSPQEIQLDSASYQTLSASSQPFFRHGNMYAPQYAAQPMSMANATSQPMNSPVSRNGRKFKLSSEKMAQAQESTAQSSVRSLSMPPTVTDATGNVDSDLSIKVSGDVGEEGDYESSTIDLTQIPKQLDKKLEYLDDESVLRPTMIKTDQVWEHKSQRNLIIKKMTRKVLGKDDQKAEKNKAFDLLDCVSRSGSLPLHSVELHVLIAATHCFDKSLMDTVIKDNKNPIEKMEKSLLIVASTIFGSSPTLLLKNENHVARLLEHCPALFEREKIGL